MRIGIFGGTFNPPHIGHIQAAKASAEQLMLDRLIVIPAGIPPHKELPDGTPSSSDRLEMTRRAFVCVPGADVSDIEIVKRQPSYTIDTIKNIRRGYPGAELFLLVGTDMYLTLDSWKDSGNLLELATPAVFSRSDDDITVIAGYSQVLRERFGTGTEVIDAHVIDISSSKLREMLPERGGAGFLTDGCYSHIIKNRLYGAKPGWDWLRDRSSIPHVLGCEEEAPRLALRWGADPDDAREAAILHDITKNLAFEEHLDIFCRHGMPISAGDAVEGKLFHQKTGALLAKSEFGASDGVAEAIRCHTTGKPGMTALEKVIYLSDYIENTRDFPGIGDLRKLAYEDMDRAMILGLEMTISDIASRGIEPDNASSDALLYLKEGICK